MVEPQAGQKREVKSTNAFWAQVLKLLGFYMGLATIGGWPFGTRGLVVAWWAGAIVFFAHFFLLLHERYKK